MVETEGLTHVHLYVRDVHRSLRFYLEVLGMEVQFWADDHKVFVGTPRRHDTIALCQGGDDARPGDGGGIDHIGFRLVDYAKLDEAVQEVEAGGGRLVERGVRDSGQPFAIVTDLDGYLIEF